MLTLYGETFPSRLLLGTAAYPTPEILKQSVRIAQPAMITVSLRRAGSGGEVGGVHVFLSEMHAVCACFYRFAPVVVDEKLRTAALTGGDAAGDFAFQFNLQHLQGQIIFCPNNTNQKNYHIVSNLRLFVATSDLLVE